MKSIVPPSACSSECKQFAAEISDRLDRLPILVGAPGSKAPQSDGRAPLPDGFERSTQNAAQPHLAAAPSAEADECAGQLGCRAGAGETLWCCRQKGKQRRDRSRGSATEAVQATGLAPAAVRICAASATARRTAGATGNSPSSVNAANRKRLRSTVAGSPNSGPGSTNGSRARSSTRSPMATSATYFAIGPAWAVIALLADRQVRGCNDRERARRSA